MPKLVVGVPCHNEAQYIEECLKSIAENDLSDVQVFISDNSTDGSSEIIENCLEMLPANKKKHFKSSKWETPANMAENWKKPFYETDSEYFIWVGGHDAVTENFFKSCLEAFEKEPEASIVSGKPFALKEDSSEVSELNVVYDFSASDPLTRYLKSASELGDCTLLYSIFKKNALKEFDFPYLGAADHILISNLLWHGTLVYCDGAGYLRRFFDSENRKAKRDQGYYLNDQNKLLWYQEYMKNFIRCSNGQYPEEIYPHIKTLLFNTLCKRFGLPSTLSTTKNPLLKVA